VPVYINGHGPLPFALDTGASRSLISAALARELGLPARGSAGMLEGVTGATNAQNFAVSSWRAGSVTLPASMIAAVGSATPGAPPSAGTLHGPVGLLGSDVLSRYGKIAIDYDKGLLVLDPPVR
jgi:Aspartyl protease